MIHPVFLRRTIMKHIRHFCVTSILTFAFSLSALAGNIECGVVSPPPPQESTISGEMATGATTTNEAAASEVISVNPTADFALDILQSVLALF
jgi:hypothetical protein